MTYVTTPEYLDDDSLALLKIMEPLVAQMGEPFQEVFAPAEFEAFARDCGHIVEENVTPEELE